MARPDPPANVVATDGDPTVVITWDAVADATSYTVYRGFAPGSSTGVIGFTDELTWTDLLAIDGVVYWYSISARTLDSGCSVLSEEDSGFATAVPIPVPDAPIIVMVTVEP